MNIRIFFSNKEQGIESIKTLKEKAFNRVGGITGDEWRAIYWVYEGIKNEEGCREKIINFKELTKDHSLYEYVAELIIKRRPSELEKKGISIQYAPGYFDFQMWLFDEICTTMGRIKSNLFFKNQEEWNELKKEQLVEYLKRYKINGEDL